jgi:hypothetical protein
MYDYLNSIGCLLGWKKKHWTWKNKPTHHNVLQTHLVTLIHVALDLVHWTFNATFQCALITTKLLYVAHWIVWVVYMSNIRMTMHFVRNSIYPCKNGPWNMMTCFCLFLVPLFLAPWSLEIVNVIAHSFVNHQAQDLANQNKEAPQGAI